MNNDNLVFDDEYEVEENTDQISEPVNEVEENTDQISEPVNEVEISEEDNQNSPVFIHTKFGNKTQPVQFTIIATGQSGTTSITGGKLRLIYGRIYFLPIDAKTSTNSDDFANIKMFSDMADKVDVRYINNGFAAIIPLQNNIMLSDETRLCVLW